MGLYHAYTMNLATIAYGTAALGFMALNVLLLIGRRADPFGYRLSLASALSALWATAAAIAAFTTFTSAAPIVDVLEVARDAGWLLVLTGVFARRVPRWLAILVPVGWVSLFVAQVLHWANPTVQMTHGGLALAPVSYTHLQSPGSSVISPKTSARADDG